MNTMARFFLGSILWLVLAALAPLPAVAKYIGSDPPCPACGNRTPIDGNASLGVPIATVSSTAVDGLDLALSYNTYNADGSRAQLDIGLGYGWTHSYSALLFNQAGHMFRYDGAGRVTRYQFIGNNAYKAAPGYFETLVKNPDGSFTITYKDGTAHRFEKVSGDTLLVNGPVYRLVSVTDRNGNRTVLAYGGGGLLTQATDVYGRSLVFAYNAQGHLASVKDPLNQATAFAYDGTGRRLVTVTDPLGKAMRFTYNVLNQVTNMVDKDGRTFSYGYRNLKPVSVVDGAGNALYQSSNPNNWATDDTALAQTQTRQYVPGTTTVKDGNGNLWRYDYDLNGCVTRVIAPVGATTRYAYDPSTLLRASETDANGHTTSYTYDSQGNLLTKTDALAHQTQFQYEPVYSNVTRIINPNTSKTEFTYDSHGNRVQETRDVGGLNITTNWTYYAASVGGNPSPASGLIKTQKVHNGADIQTTAYEYDANGNRNKSTDPLGNVTQALYNPVGNLTQATDGNGHLTTYAYDPLNRLTQKTDPLGFTAHYAYDGMGNQIQVDKQVTKAPDSFQVTQNQYDLRSRLVKAVQDSAGLNLATSYTYDGNNNRISMSDPRGNVTQYAFDTQNRPAMVTDALANATRTQYDPAGNRTCVIDANGHDTFYQYDSLNRLSRETRKIGAQSCADADADDILTQTFYDTGAAIPPADCKNPQCAGPIPGSSTPAYAIDPEGKYVYFKYDEINRSVMTIRKVGDTADACDSDDWCAITQYDAVGNVLARYDANGNPTTYTYFLNNWLKTEANALAETTSYTYDGVGKVKTVHTPGGNTTTNTYNARNELVQVDDLVGRVANYAYDGIGNRKAELDGNGNGPIFSYDAVNRPTAVTDAMGQTSQMQYDPDGNLTQTTDRDGHVVCFVYDAINRQIRQVHKVGDTNCLAGGGNGDADDVWNKTVYDTVGNIIERTTAKQGGTPAICNGGSPTADCEITRYVYNEVNWRVQEIYPPRQADDTTKNTKEFAYNNLGKVISRVDQNGSVTCYVYNDLYYLIQRGYPEYFGLGCFDPGFGGRDPDTFFYDVGGRMSFARGGVGSGFDIFTYDAANRVLTSSQFTQTVSYSYDIPNRKRTVTYPGGKVVVEQSDLRERLDTVNGDAIADYTYDPGNRVTSRDYGNGTHTTYGYNPRNLITDLNLTKPDTSLIGGFAYGYDPTDNKLFEAKAHDPNHSEDYGYDALNRLVDYKVGLLDPFNGNIPAPLTQTQYNLDKLGNWDSKITDSVTQTRQHNADNEITTIDAVPLAYDNNGNLIEDTIYRYSYDSENRLTQVLRKSDNTGVDYFYDALSRRVGKGFSTPFIPDTVTYYYYDGERLIEEQDNVGTTQATYVYGNYIDEVLTMDRGGQTTYYHQNALWSTVAVTDSAASVRESYAYDAYGQPTVTDGMGNPLGTHSNVGNPWLFTGRQFDEESGLYDYRSRHYDPVKGRFLQRDSIGVWGDPANLGNGYVYVGNSPPNSIDPFGRKQWRKAGESVGGCITRISNSIDNGDYGFDWWLGYQLCPPCIIGGVAGLCAGLADAAATTLSNTGLFLMTFDGDGYGGRGAGGTWRTGLALPPASMLTAVGSGSSGLAFTGNRPGPNPDPNYCLRHPGSPGCWDFPDLSSAPTLSSAGLAFVNCQWTPMAPECPLHICTIIPWAPQCWMPGGAAAEISSGYSRRTRELLSGSPLVDPVNGSDGPQKVIVVYGEDGKCRVCIGGASACKTACGGGKASAL